MSSFSERVIEVVKGIPEGSVMSYGEVASRAGSPGAARAVGSVMSANRRPDVPCHRVVRSDGDIGSYNRGRKNKRSKLENEGVRLEGDRIAARKKVVTIGGGTGSFVVLSALKRHPVDITAIISMSDDGGSTGVLRDQYGVLPPGDIRKAMVALSGSGDTLRALFNYRFADGSFKGHSFGNLFLAALEKITGDFSAAIEEASSVLDIEGKVVPVTLADVRLHAVLENGRVLDGESVIDLSRVRSPIGSVWLDPSGVANPSAVKAVKEADLIVICPGSLYTSIIPNFLVPGFREAVAGSAAKKAFVLNLMTKDGETGGMNASDLIRTLERYLGSGVIDFVVANNKVPSRSALALYKKERARPVFPPRSSGKNGWKVVKEDLIAKGDLVRHDPDGKLAEVLLSLI